MKEKVTEVLQSIYDPEIPVNIWELGFIYKLEVNENNDVYILMTLTAPNCPVAETLPTEVETKVKEIPGVGNVTVELTFEPAWDTEMMSESAKIELNLLY
ncbi:MAG: SUF system Fe-S cluster assembly protein [Bacteroidales bacterium]|nr:SUF system Fe-S cluster assembly protein [Bacteroidales bacterium]